MFKIGLENRDFCKSLHFYILDAGKKNIYIYIYIFFFYLCCGALASALIYIKALKIAEEERLAGYKNLTVDSVTY